MRIPISAALLLTLSSCGGKAVFTGEGERGALDGDGVASGRDEPPAQGDGDVGIDPGPPSVEEPLLFGPAESPYGESYERWMERYWQWHLSLPLEGHPREGGDCGLGQSTAEGDVLFLTTGLNGEQTERVCIIEEGRPLFFVLNSALHFPNADCRVCDADLHGPEAWFSGLEPALDELAGRLEPNSVELEIDGVRQEVGDDYFYEAAEPFYIDVAESDPYFQCTGAFSQDACGWEGGVQRPFTSVGYAVMLRPLPAGSHVIRFGALGSDGLWDTDVTYHLRVGVVR